MSRPREWPRPWVDPSQCVHPAPVASLKFKDSDERVFQCMACGKTMTANDLKKNQKRKQ